MSPHVANIFNRQKLEIITKIMIIAQPKLVMSMVDRLVYRPALCTVVSLLFTVQGGARV